MQDLSSNSCNFLFRERHRRIKKIFCLISKYISVLLCVRFVPHLVHRRFLYFPNTIHTLYRCFRDDDESEVLSLCYLYCNIYFLPHSISTHKERAHLFCFCSYICCYRDLQ